MQLPRELLTKPGTFTPEERQAMERHVEYARETLKNINFELPVVEAISQMNEFMDGSGYPEKAARGRDRHLRPHPVGCEHVLRADPAPLVS